MHIFESSTCIT